MQCYYCKECFPSKESAYIHKQTCKLKALSLGPSFSADLSKKNRSLRTKVIGTYEWALNQSSKDTTKKIKDSISKLSSNKLKNEVLKLERIIIHSSVINKLQVKRLIAFSHILKIKLEKELVAAEIKEQQEKRKNAVNNMKKALKPDVAPSNDIMDVYINSGERLVKSGGLPGLGKK